MRWYFPSWNGDFRLEPDRLNPRTTVLSMVRPTAHEQKVLKGLEVVFREKGWWSGDEPLYTPQKRETAMTVATIYAPLAEIGPVIARHVKPGKSTLTALRFEDGKVLAIEGVDSELADGVRVAMGEPIAPSDIVPPAPAAAATVQRPTPCCPECIPNSVGPATEVLLDFLTPEQHESWAKDRCFLAVGGYTGVRYLLCHRHTPRAQKIGRVCYSLDDDAVVHFHQTEVPPEEEILAAKLILELREDWLRNEATLFKPNRSIGRFKNPFGDYLDGVADAQMMERFGGLLGFRNDPRKRKVTVAVNENP